jgi:ATP-dependent helicase/nuclease subunit A
MPEWTEDQKKAIEHRGHDILVSAAAGSGKTTILIERILCELKSDEDVDNLLVATFTEAAAQEMKDRLLKALKEAVNQTDDADEKRRLQKQIFRIPMANISTLHAFCLSVIKKFYYVIDLDPNFRLLSDDTEKSIIQEQAYDNVRNKYYSKEDIDFIKLTNNFTNDKTDDGLKDIVFKLYDFAITTSDTKAYLDDLSKTYQFVNSFSQTEFYREEFLPQIKSRLDELLLTVKHGLDLASEDDLAQTYLDVFKEAEERLQKVNSELSQYNYDQLQDIFYNFKFKNKKQRVTKAEKEGKDLSLMNETGEVKKTLDDQLKSLVTDYFLKSETGVNEALKVAQSLVQKLVEVEYSFINEFQKLKTNSHVLDFNDLEHRAVDILEGEVDGRKIAQEYYQNKFHELMIDEYQDVNAMQDKIIDLLSCENNHRFMVGDIKQSIYGFRQAAPRLFTEKYETFQRDDNDDELIQLSMNFRSSKAVDDFVNNIFTRIFDKKIGDIDYDEKSKLITGTNFPESVDTINEFDVYVGDEDEEVTKRQTLISAAAKKIQALIDQGFEIYDSKMKADSEEKKIRPLKYSDIAILSRVRDSNTDIISYFSKVNIPVMVKDAQNYFQTTELQIMMSMLKLVDNPYEDIPLVAVLHSPIVGLNEEELAKIRLVDKRNIYFTALNEYVASENAEEHLKNKISSFLVQLDNYRDFANKNSIARLIWKIYQETGILEYVSGMPGGKQRAANLHALYQRANAYEENNYKGLHQFINFIERMQKLDKDLSQPNSIEANDDTVKVMTVHGSKGLEFPIVIYLDMDKKFNMMDVNSDTVFDAQKGIGITVADNETRLKYRTIPRGIISYQKKIATVSEEMRLLYVALTRAKQKLIMLGFTKDSDKLLKTWNNVSMTNGLVNESIRMKANSFQNFVGISTLQDAKAPEYYDEASHLQFKLIEAKAEDAKAPKNQKIKLLPKEPSQLFKDAVADILDLDYQYQESVETTAYQSVSEIKGLFEDPDSKNMAEMLPEKSRYNLGSFAQPEFLTKTKKVTNAEVGSATHLVLQKINIEKTPEIADFEELITQMTNEKLLTPELAKKIDCASLAKFYQSDLGQKIVANHQNVSREFPCSILMPAKRLFKDTAKDYSVNDKILVHGIIDGVIELDEGVIIFDYKTDHATSQNEDELVKKYSGQVNLYAKAIEAIKKKPVLGKYLYFLKKDRAVKL